MHACVYQRRLLAAGRCGPTCFAWPCLLPLSVPLLPPHLSPLCPCLCSITCNVTCLLLLHTCWPTRSGPRKSAPALLPRTHGPGGAGAHTGLPCKDNGHGAGAAHAGMLRRPWCRSSACWDAEVAMVQDLPTPHHANVPSRVLASRPHGVVLNLCHQVYTCR